MTKRISYPQPFDVARNKIFVPNEDGSTFTPVHSVLPEFLQWCKSGGMAISESVKVVDVSQHRYGMKAVKLIKKSELLFDIPRSMLLWEENYTKLIPKLSSIKSKSGWVKLLLVLMLEYTNPQSKWSPYLDFAPSSEIMDMPFYWQHNIKKKILDDTPLSSLAEKDVKNVECEYETIALPFIKANNEVGFNESLHTLELFKQMVGFVMAYSFTEPCQDSEMCNPPKMVPMADVLNHVSEHNAHLQFGEKSLKMIAIKDILPGSEIFNTYGHLSNSQLLQMYGFVENNYDNKHDIVDIPVVYLKIADKIEYLHEKWEYLFGSTKGVLQDCESIAIGLNGIYSFDEAKLLLKVLCMSRLDFISYYEQEWESDASDSDESSSESESVSILSYSKVSSSFSTYWKSLLEYAGERQYNELVLTLANKEKLNFDNNLDRSRNDKVIMMLGSQISILRSLRKACEF